MSYALTEAGAGSDAAAMTTRYERDGERGAERHETVHHRAPASRTPTWSSRPKDPSLRSKGVSAFLVMRDDPGVEFGRKEDKMGIRGSPTREVILTDARIPADRLIGEEGSGFGYAMTTLDYSRPAIAAQALGIAQGRSTSRAGTRTERQQFGKPVAEFQGVFVHARRHGDAARGRADARLTRRSAPLRRGRSPEDVLLQLAKCFASDAAMSITTDAVQVLGGYGYMREYPVERFMRDAKITQIYEGTNQIQRVRDPLASC
jgi:alkylation response protein AidB-like acyl-CoA dehydrogenase